MSTLQDPRERIKTFLTTYLDTTGITKDNDSSATTHICYSGALYPLKLVFYGSKNVDCLTTVEVPTLEAIKNYIGQIIGYIEKVPIQIFCIDKTGITGELIIWKAMQEVRYAIEENWEGSYYTIDEGNVQTQDMGGWKLYSQRITLLYKRSTTPSAAPTAPAFTYGVGFTFECDRLSEGHEGTWTFTQGAGSTCTCVINQDGNIYFDQTVFSSDSMVETDTAGSNLGINTTTFPKIRFRYKTSGNAKCKIVVTGSGYTQTVLSETASSVWTVAEVSLTAGKTLDHIWIYCCDGTGTVEVDFIQIYTGTYILPNCLKMNIDEPLKDSIIGVPGMSGDLQNILGSGLITVQMICALDLEPSSLTWKRPQTTTPKTDVHESDIFSETRHLQGLEGLWGPLLWVWLDLGEPAKQFKARLTKVRPALAGEEQTVELTFVEYRHGSAEDETTSERYGHAL